MTSRAPPAITPDIRTTNHCKGINTSNNHNKNSSTDDAAASDSSKKVVSFGLFHSSKSPTKRKVSAKATTTMMVTKEEAMRQYKLYRSSPTFFPSYDRIILVKLPREYLPASLTTTNHQDSASTIANSNDFYYYYWPALLYNNLVEVVRDLSPNEAPLLKARLIVEYKKYPTRKVARLIGWNNDIIDVDDDHDDNCYNEKDKKRATNKDIVLFAESKLELLRLPCTDNIEETMMENETMNFCESLAEMEKMYCHLLQLAATKNRKSKCDENNKMNKNAIQQFAIRFGYALDMAMNCLSCDIGSEPLLPRIYEENYQEDELPQEMMMTEKRNHDVCKTPNSSMATNDGGDSNGARTTHGNKKHSPAEDSMFSTAAVANGDDYNSGVSEQQKFTKTSTTVIRGTTRKNETKDKQLRSNEMNGGDDDAKVMTKKTVRPVTTSTTTVARGGAVVVGRSKPPIDKACRDDTIAVAPVTTKSVKVKAPEEDTTKEIIPWKDVWATMKRCGWTWKGGSGLMTDYYYIKPKCKVQGGVCGVDYFVSVGDTIEFARRTYGWDEHGVSPLTREQLFSLIEEHAKYAGEMVPPLKGELNPNGPWRDAWEVMLRSGWTWRAGSGLMLDYYYIKPGRKVGGGVEVQDYFVRVEDVQQFARRNYGWRGHTSGDSGEVHDTEDSGATKAKKRRLSSSDGSGENMNQVPMRNHSKMEAKKPAAKDNVIAEAATKRMRPAKAKSELQESTEDDDDDTVDDEDETRSTFSQSVLQSKKLFSDECADEIIPPLVVDKLGNETWSKAWKMMRDSGWSWRVGTGLMTDYYYIKPGCKVKGGVVGRDYFILAEDVQRFAMRNYGWSGGNFTGDNERKRSSSAVEDMPSIEKLRCGEVGDASSNPRQTVSYSTSKAEPSIPPSNPYEKKALWQKLQKKGWKAISAGRYNKLHDWYYVRPHCDPGDSESKLGVDFFLCEEDAIEAAKEYGDEEEVEVDDDEAGQQEQLLKEAISPIRSARKGTPAGPLSTPQDCRTRPQDPAIPLLSSPESCSSASQYDMFEWHNLWPVLERTGWRCIKAGKYNPLHNYYYVRPNRDPGDKDCVFGKHYFDSKDDVISYVKGDEDGRDRRGKKDACRKSMGVMLGAFEEVANE